MSMEQRVERNKITVRSLYDLMFNRCRPADALKR